MFLLCVVLGEMLSKDNANAMIEGYTWYFINVSFRPEEWVIQVQETVHHTNLALCPICLFVCGECTSQLNTIVATGKFSL